MEMFAKTIYDEELSEGMTYLPTKDTGLQNDIIVDSGETYKYFKHRLCLYIVEGEKVKPVLIKLPPVSPTREFIPEDIYAFITGNYQILLDFANLAIDAYTFFDKLQKAQNLSLIAEMSTYSPDRTGLSVWVYVDDTNSYLKSGHNQSYRIKFQQDNDLKNPRLWMPITIPTLEVITKENIPPCKIHKKEVNLVVEWAKLNLELLLSLRDGNISGAEFKKQMRKINGVNVVVKSEISPLNENKEIKRIQDLIEKTK